VDLQMDVVDGYAPARPIRLDAPIPKNGGGQRQPRNGQARTGQGPQGRAAGKPAHRPHGKPAARTAHAGPKQRSNGQGARGGRRDSRA
jgi:ATP-dependent RNA helicase RhlE